MKKFGLTLRASLAATLLAAASNAFAFGGLFDGGLFRSAAPEPEYVAEDASFFGSEALTIDGSYAAAFESAVPFATSASNSSYSGCASCAGDSGVVYGGVPASFDYDSCGYVCDPCASYETSWVSVGYATPYRPFRPVRNILAGVKNFLFSGCYRYCQPAYVCDPSWTVVDESWSPCATCEIGCGGDMYAPRGCCGDGYAPGETNELNPATGLPGVDASLSPTPTPIQATDGGVAPIQAPAVPAAQPTSSGFETVPTPEPNSNVGAGVLNMLVPADSTVYVNGYRTRQTGTTRSFAANNLQLGETYSFEIRVVAVRNGQTYEDVQHATLTAGEATALAFNLSLRSNQAVAAR